MKIYLQLTILITISYVLEARPHQNIDVETEDNQGNGAQYFGCIFPFQYVNPYYNDLTARTWANVLGYNMNRVANPIPYRTECDCMYPFAMNYKGVCIKEWECNEWEVFGNAYESGSPDSVPDSVENASDNNQEFTENDSIPVGDGEPANSISLVVMNDEIQRSDDDANNVECEYVYDSDYDCCCDSECDEDQPQSPAGPQEGEAQSETQPPQHETPSQDKENQTEPQSESLPKPQPETEAEDDIETYGSGEYSDEGNDDHSEESESTEKYDSEEYASEEEPEIGTEKNLEPGKEIDKPNPTIEDVKLNSTETSINSTILEPPTILNSTPEQTTSKQVPTNSTNLEAS